MTSILVLLVLLPVIIGYFFAALFYPLAILLTAALLMLGIFLAPFCLVIFAIWKSFRSLNSRSIREIPIIDNGSPLIDLASLIPNLLPSPLVNRSHDEFLGRRIIAEKLLAAQRQLQPDLKLLLTKCYMPSPVGDLDENVHSTGAAIDVTLVSANHQNVEMGDFDWQKEFPHLHSVRLDAKEVGVIAWNNRHLLSQSLESVGFVNDPSQWWHWSYGDQRWAKASGAEFAIYGPVSAK